MKKITEEFLRNMVNNLNFSNITMSDAAAKINEYFHKNENAFQVGDTVYSKISNMSYLIVVIDDEGLPHFPKYKYYLKNIEYGSYVWATENDIVKL